MSKQALGLRVVKPVDLAELRPVMPQEVPDLVESVGRPLTDMVLGRLDELQDDLGEMMSEVSTQVTREHRGTEGHVMGMLAELRDIASAQLEQQQAMLAAVTQLAESVATLAANSSA